MTRPYWTSFAQVFPTCWVTSFPTSTFAGSDAIIASSFFVVVIALGFESTFYRGTGATIYRKETAPIRELPLDYD